jgi:hypothetical protein
MSGNKHCCLCGEVRLPHQAPTESLSNQTAMLNMKEHRELKPGRWETSPQMLVSVCLWRNGGTARGATHICDECLIVGLEEARSFVEHELTLRRAMAQALKQLQGAQPTEPQVRTSTT